MNPETPQPPPPASLDADVAAFLSAPTPRRDIPLDVESEAYAQIAPAKQLLLIMVLIVGGAFLLFGANMTPSQMRHDEELSAEHATVQGVVLSAEPVRTSVAGTKGPYVTVFRFSFTFTPAYAYWAQTHGYGGIEGVCYAKEKLWKPGDQVAVEYNPRNTKIARIQGARIDAAGDDGIAAWSRNRIILAVMGLLFLGLGILAGRKYFQQRARCRRLLENGAVDEFLVADLDIVEKKFRQSTTYVYVFHLKPANREDDTHTYFSQFTKKSQIDYAQALRREKTTTFGLYDPAGTGDKREVLMVRSSFQ